jgi:hypothetical protein
LPAAAQAGLLGAEAGSLQPPAHQPPVLFTPAGIVFSGKKNLGEACFEPAPKCRSGCL